MTTHSSEPIYVSFLPEELDLLREQLRATPVKTSFTLNIGTGLNHCTAPVTLEVAWAWLLPNGVLRLAGGFAPYFQQFYQVDSETWYCLNLRPGHYIGPMRVHDESDPSRLLKADGPIQLWDLAYDIEFEIEPSDLAELVEGLSVGSHPLQCNPRLSYVQATHRPVRSWDHQSHTHCPERVGRLAVTDAWLIDYDLQPAPMFEVGQKVHGHYGTLRLEGIYPQCIRPNLGLPSDSNWYGYLQLPQTNFKPHWLQR